MYGVVNVGIVCVLNMYVKVCMIALYVLYMHVRVCMIALYVRMYYVYVCELAANVCASVCACYFYNSLESIFTCVSVRGEDTDSAVNTS